MANDSENGIELEVERRYDDRREQSDRRTEGVTTEYSGPERRKTNRRIDGSAEASPSPKVERRRQIDPTTCERDYTTDEIEFMTAMDDYKRRSGRQFPTWSEVLEVLYAMGYRKVAEPKEIKL